MEKAIDATDEPSYSFSSLHKFMVTTSFRKRSAISEAPSHFSEQQMFPLGVRGGRCQFASFSAQSFCVIVLSSQYASGLHDDL